MGLLDNPDTAGNLSLAAGLLGGGNFGQAMQRGLMGYQDTSNTIQDRALKRQAQEIAIQQNAAQLKDMLWKRQMGNSILGLDGNGGQAAADPSQGAPAPSTGMGNTPPMGGQSSQGPTTGPGTTPTAGGTFAGIPRAAVGLSLAGMGDLAKMAESAAQPQSDIGKILRDGGIDRNSALGQQLLQGSMAKANYIAPVSGRPGGYLAYPNGTMEQLPHVPDGFTAIKGQDGQFHMVPVDGGLPAMQQSATATALGKAAAEPTVRYQGTTPTFSTKAQDVGLASGVNPMQGLPSAQSGMTSSFQGPAEQVMRQIAGLKDPQERANAFDAYSRQMTGGGAAPVAQATPVLAPGVDKGAVLGQEELSTKGKQLTTDNASAQTVISRLQNIKMLAPGAIAGGETSRRDYFNSLLALGGIKGAEDAKTASDLVDKNANQIVGALRMGSGGGGSDALQTLLAAANPNRHMTKEAIAEATDQLIASQNALQAKAKLLNPHYMGRDPQAYGSKELEFDTNADPRIWQLNGMQPDAQAKYVKSLDPAVAADLLKKRQALKNLGVF